MQLFERALAINVPRYQLMGHYADDWVGGGLWIHTEAGSKSRTLELDFSTQCGIPANLVRLTLKVKGHRQKRYRLSRGVVETIRVPLEASAQILEWHFDPTFVPSESGAGDDQRALALKLLGCRIISEGAEPIDLLHLGSSA